MSHIVAIQTEVRDVAAIAAACRRLNLPQPVHGRTQLFTAQATGHAVQLPGWRYPIVCDTSAGTVTFDHYEGAWGERKFLDQFLQIYAVEKARLEARKNGHAVTEQPLADGSIRLTVHVGGRKLTTSTDTGNTERRRMSRELRDRWSREAAKLLKGRTIKTAGYVADEEFGSLLALELDNGTVAFVMADDEGNGPGALHLQSGSTSTILPQVR